MLELNILSNGSKITITNKQLIDIAKFTGETIEKTTNLLRQLATDNFNKLMEVIQGK